MEIIPSLFLLVATGLFWGIVLSVAILLIKQILHTFEISSR